MSSVRGKGLIIRKRVVPNINAKKTELISSSVNETQTPLSQESKPPVQKVSTDGNNTVINPSITVIKNDVSPAVTSSSVLEASDSDKSVAINSPESSKKDSICLAAKESADKLTNCDTCEVGGTTNLKQTCIKPPVIANIPCVPISGSKTDKNLALPLALAKLKKRAAPVVPKKRPAPDITSQPVECANSGKPLVNEDETDQISSQNKDGQIKEKDPLSNSVNNLIVKENPQNDSEELQPQSISDVNHSVVNDKLSETTKQNPILNPSIDKLLKKRAAPVLPKKRPLPNVSNSSKEIPKDSLKLIDNKNYDNQENNRINQDGSLSISSNKSTFLDLKNQQNSKNITSHPELPNQKIPLASTESTLKKSDETVRQSVPNIEDENLKNDFTSSTKEVQNKVASNKIIKKRLGPKIVNKNASSVVKSISCKDDVKIPDDSNTLDLKPQSGVVHQSNDSTQQDSMHLIESNKNNDELKENEVVNSSQICVENKTDVTVESKSCQSTSNPASPPVVEGVLRIYLNCWPQYPLDDLKDDPFFEDRNIQELGKISIFKNKDKNIAYCDMASNVDFINIPKNWAYVNFNKLIKEEFKDDEYEEVVNPVNEDFSETNDSFNNQCESETQTYVNQESLSDKLTDDEQLSNESDELNTAHNQINQLNEEIKEDDKPIEIKDKTTEEDCNKDVTAPGENVTKTPYKLRKTKALGNVNYDETEIDDGRLEDIFSNSERSDSEYEGEDKIKSKCEPKKRKRRSKKISDKKTKTPSVKDAAKEVNAEKKERVKSSKPRKLLENASPFMKLGNQVKNKNKWDQDGNCAEPEKLELKDFIFYVPKTVPMSQEAKEQKTSLTNEEPNETKEDKQQEEEEEENHGPKLIVKDGKIIVDPNSTKIKRTPIIHFKSEKWEKPREINDPWEVRETMKFYANLWKYGIDYSVLAASFPKKSRDALKKKFSYEERYNGSLLGKTLTKKLPLESVLREVVLIDSLEKLNCKRKANNQKVTKENTKKEKKQPRHCLLQKRRMKSNKNQDPKKIKLDNNQFDEIQIDDDSRDWSKENDEAISKETNPLNMKDVITFSTNVFYKDMNIVESVSFHPSAIQPVDINVTISHEPEPGISPQDTAIK